MKNSSHPILLLSSILAIAIFTTGCPIGIAYPFCTESQIEKMDKKLLGTWVAVSDSVEILEMKIMKEDDITYAVEVIEKGEMYMLDGNRFLSWATKLEGHDFIFSQAVESENPEYYLYHFAFEGKKLVLHDVSLLVGGMDAVTSTEAFREEVAASLKQPDCLTSRIEYVKK